MCDVGNNIRKYRKNAGLTQEELGRLSGLSTMSIRRYESNDRKPNIEQLRKISSALGIILGNLLEGNFNEYLDEIREDFSSSGKKVPDSFQIEVDDKFVVQLEKVKKMLSANPKDPRTRAQVKHALNDIVCELGYKNERDFIIKQIELNINSLNEKGLTKVLGLTQDLLLITDYLADIESEKEKSTFELNAAHKRTDIEVTDEMQKHDDAIMDDDSEWE